jgi:spermidine synthase
MTVTLFRAVRPPCVLVIGGSEGGMKRAIACSYDVTTGTLYRETVLRIPSQCARYMHALPRIRLGLKRIFVDGDAGPVQSRWPSL